MALFGKGSTAVARPTKNSIEDWLKKRIAELAEIAVDEIDVSQDFTTFGLQSRHGVELSGDLEKWLGKRLSATLIWDYPTISSLAEHLAEES